MASQDNQPAGPAGDDARTRKLIAIVKEPVSLHIMMLLIVYRELSLSQMTDAIKKSKPTIHRRLQVMIDCGLVVESKEEHVRGNILAKYYKIDESVIGKMPRITKEKLDAMDAEQKLVLTSGTRLNLPSSSRQALSMRFAVILMASIPEPSSCHFLTRWIFT
jgi:DNA-binding transcriptional ArsR family regulator